jgi:hypothetical protein
MLALLVNVNFNCEELMKRKNECCAVYRKGMDEIIAQTQYCYLIKDAPKYSSFPFKFCPWCGKRIEVLTLDVDEILYNAGSY